MAELTVTPSASLPTRDRDEILSLCRLAYREDLAALFRSVGPATHVRCRHEGRLVSHAMWVTRYLQAGVRPPLPTAYVEAVATHPAFERRGLATTVMRRLASEIPPAFELAALCPATPRLYERLGWRFWRGPLGIRLVSGRREATPGERVMVLPLPGRPALDLDAPVSAEWREGELW